MDVRVGIITEYAGIGIKQATADLEHFSKQAKGKVASLYAGASEDFKKLNPELAQFTQLTAGATTKTTGFWKELGTLRSQLMSLTVVLGAAIFGIVIAAKKAFEFGVLGAQVIQVTKSFDSLVRVSGTFPDLMERLREAARGTVSDFDLMSATMTVVAGTTGDMQKSLLDAAPRLMEIAKAANILNPALGDTQYMFDSITQGVKRQERRILDNLGIIVRLREANVRYAEAMDTTVEAMTAEEIQQSFLNETLRVGAFLIEQVGGTTDSAVDPFMRLTTSVQNLKNELATLASPTASRVVVALTDIIKLISFSIGSMDEQRKAIEQNTTSYEEYRKQIEKLLEFQLLLKLAFGLGLLGLLSYAKATKEILTPAMREAIKATDQWVTELETANKVIIPTIEEETDALLELAQFGLQQAGLKGNIAAVAQMALAQAIVPTNLAVDQQKLALMTLAGQYDTTTKEGLNQFLAALLQTIPGMEGAIGINNVYVDALARLQAQAQTTARAQSILNAQLAGARAGFAGPFAGLIDSYTGKINALNDQLAQAGGGGGGAARQPVPVDMEEVRLKEAVAAADLRDAYHGLNEVEEKITEQEEMLAKAREEGADPAWIEYLEGSIQYLKDEQARAQLAIFEKKKALQELTDILNGVVVAEEAYVGSSGGAAKAAINLKDEIAKLNDELDKEIKKMVIMAAVTELLQDPTKETVKAATDLGIKFGVFDVASATAIEGAFLLATAFKAGVINQKKFGTGMNLVVGQMESLMPRVDIVKGVIRSVLPDADETATIQQPIIDLIADLLIELEDTQTAAEKTKEKGIDPLIESLGKDEVAGAANFPKAVKDSLTALDSLDKAFGLSQAEGGGLFLFRVAIGALVTDLGAMLQRIKDAQALLLPGGGTLPPPVGTPGGSHGLDFIVPPGYPNDSFPVRVQSGEHVKVTPVSQSPITYGRKRKRETVVQVNNMVVNLSGVQNAGQFLDDLRDVLGNL